MISGNLNEIIVAGSASDLPMLFFQENGILQNHYMQPYPNIGSTGYFY